MGSRAAQTPTMNSLVKKLSRSQKMTQAHLASCLGLHPSHISQYMNGHTNIRSDLFCSLINLLGVDLKGIIANKISEQLKVEKDSDEELMLLLRRLPLAEKQKIRWIVKRLSQAKE